MRRILALLALGALAACAPEQKAKIEEDFSKRLSPGCYTVDLFDPYRLEYPEAGVSAENRKFLGVWKNGAWGGNWCHDLYITNVFADGSVELLDAYGPSAKHGHEATVYKRKGKIENGVLTFLSHKQTPVSYRLAGEYLVGTRKDLFGTIEITMSRTDRLAEVPVPPRKPVRS
ncbi:MAG: hypothetical protein AAGH68_14595 [Pseudomonadota bacterium]